jgi:hypothetical protein
MRQIWKRTARNILGHRNDNIGDAMTLYRGDGGQHTKTTPKGKLNNAQGPRIHREILLHHNIEYKYTLAASRAP